jgi:glutamate-1-semialdehyde 2,1-aminomutase
MNMSATEIVVLPSANNAAAGSPGAAESTSSAPDWVSRRRLAPDEYGRLIERAKAITAAELEKYSARTPKSQAANARAQQSLPMGVPSSFQFYDPHPVVAAKAKGSWLEDVDGNHYVDFNMGYGSLFTGHLHPTVIDAVRASLEIGSLFVTPCESNADVAENLCMRFGMGMFRFTNSGTEATHDAIRVARGFTGRSKIIKVEGGYHGHHDEVMISTKPPLDKAGPADNPTPYPNSKGITDAAMGEVRVVPFNDLAALERALAPGDVACFIVEPALENIGICMPQAGYLEGARALTRKYGTMLLFDEVKTGLTASYHGACGYFGVQPDLVAMAKSIGGGFPIGAFGGTNEVMSVVADGSVLHLGTYNGNPMVMAAAKATLFDVLTREAIDAACAMNHEAVVHANEIIERYELPAHTVELGAKGCITWSYEPIKNYRDYKATDFTLAYAQWIWGINRGVLLPPGLDEQWLISVQHTADDLAHHADVFETFAQALRK